MDQERELLLDHLKAGYSNVQGVIQFVDTKTAFITGLSTLVFSFPAWLPAGFEAASSQALRPFLEGLPWWRWGILALPLFSVICGVICLAAAIFSVIPRNPRAKIPPTILFSFEPSPKWNWRKYVPWIQKASAPTTPSFDAAWLNLTSRPIEEAIIEEYRTQLKSIGQIVGRKVALQQRAGKFLFCQISFLVLFMLSLGLALLPEWAGADQGSEDNPSEHRQNHVEMPASETTIPAIPID